LRLNKLLAKLIA